MPRESHCEKEGILLRVACLSVGLRNGFTQWYYLATLQHWECVKNYFHNSSFAIEMITLDAIYSIHSLVLKNSQRALEVAQPRRTKRLKAERFSDTPLLFRPHTSKIGTDIGQSECYRIPHTVSRTYGLGPYG